MVSYKVGITSADSKKRLQAFAQDGWVAHALIWFAAGVDAIAVEERFFFELRRVRSIPVFLTNNDMRRTGGWTETFSSSLISRETVLELLLDVAGCSSQEYEVRTNFIS